MRSASVGLTKPRLRLLAAAVVLLTVTAFLIVVASAVRADAVRMSAVRAAGAPAGFVQRQGRYLTLDGQPYRFVGFNAYGITGCATGRPWTQAEIDAYLTSLPPASMTRTWAFQHFGVEQLELLVARAEAHGQKLILSLANADADCGEAKKDNAWYAGGYRGQYLSWVRTVVSRFRNSPAIGMWEIMNEPGHKSTVDDTTMKAFFDETAATIKEIDPYHLVSTGSMSEYTPGTNDFGYVHSGPNIDVGSLHEYDEDHNDQIISRHLPRTLTPLYQIDKPLIVGETGILAGTRGCPVSLEQRATMLQKEFDGYFLAGVAGVLVWNYTPTPRSSDDTSCKYEVRAPDPDPTIAMVRNYRMPTPLAPAIQLVARSTGKCVAVPGAATGNGIVLQQQTCSGAPHQRFSLQPAADGFYRLVASHSGKCIEVKDQSYALDALIQQADCSNGAHQQIRVEPTDSGYYRIIFRSSNQCLRVLGGSTAENASLSQFDCKTPTLTSQQFKLTT